MAVSDFAVMRSGQRYGIANEQFATGSADRDDTAGVVTFTWVALGAMPEGMTLAELEASLEAASRDGFTHSLVWVDTAG